MYVPLPWSNRVEGLETPSRALPFCSVSSSQQLGLWRLRFTSALPAREGQCGRAPGRPTNRPRRSVAQGTGAAESYQTVEKSQTPMALPPAPLHKSLHKSPHVAPHGRLSLQGSPFGALFRYLSIKDTSPEAARPSSSIHTTTQSVQLLGSAFFSPQENETLSSVGN